MKNQTLKYWVVFTTITVHLWIVVTGIALWYGVPDPTQLDTPVYWGLVFLNVALSNLYCYWAGIKRT